MNQQERQGHQFFGKGAFDAAWALIDRSDRSEDEDLEMFLAAAASRWHKGQLGGAERLSLGDWQLAHVAALLGIAPPALAFARRNLQRTEAEGWAGWRLASAHGGDGTGVRGRG